MWRPLIFPAWNVTASSMPSISLRYRHPLLFSMGPVDHMAEWLGGKSL